MTDYITKKTKPTYITKKVKPEYIKKKEPKPEYIKKKTPIQKTMESKAKSYTDILPGKKKYHTMLIGEKVAQEGSVAKRGEFKRAIKRIAERPSGFSGGGRALRGLGKAFMKGGKVK